MVWIRFWRSRICSAGIMCIAATVTSLPQQPDSRNVCNKVPGAPCLQVTLAGDGTGRVTSDPKGISCPSVCVATFLPYQQKITLRATAASGSTFANWVGGCLPRDAPMCVVSLSAASFVTARFDK
jgi:hypothetical protein